MRADVLVAGALGRPGLALEATEKSPCNILFEVDARILIDYFLSQLFGKMLITDTQHIESDPVVEKLHLEWFVRCNPWSGVQRDCVPGHLNPGSWDLVALKELPSGVCAVHLEPVISATEFLQQAEIMKCRADEQQFSIECLSCLSSQLIGPEEVPMRVVKEQGCTELTEEPDCLPSQLRVWNPGLYLL